MHGKSSVGTIDSDLPIGYVAHTHKTKNGEKKTQIPVFRRDYVDNSRYSAGRMKPGTHPVSETPTDADIRHIAAAIARRERRHG